MNGKTERSSLHKNPISSKLKHAQQTKRRNISSDFKLLIDKNKYYESRLPT